MSRVSQSVSDAVYKRDHGRCLHCGSTEVTIQHRKNVGHGGAKKDSPLHQHQNLILLCGAYNALIETDAREAERARFYGWKARSLLEALEQQVYDVGTDEWYQLLADGSRVPVDPNFPIIEDVSF